MRVPYCIPDKEAFIVKPPFKKHHTDAGTDFYIPTKGKISLRTKNESTDFREYDTTKPELYTENPNLECGVLVILEPGDNVLIASGICMEIDLAQMALVCNRSGIASNNSLVVGAEICDTLYKGMIMFDIHNIGNRPQEIRVDTRITQIVMVPIISCAFMEVNSDELYDWDTGLKRGEAGFGASGVK